MVVYVTKGSEAARLLQEQFFHVAGESAYTRIYEHRVAQRNVTIVKRSDTRHTHAPRRRSVLSALKRDAVIRITQNR